MYIIETTKLEVSVSIRDDNEKGNESIARCIKVEYKSCDSPAPTLVSVALYFHIDTKFPLILRQLFFWPRLKAMLFLLRLKSDTLDSGSNFCILRVNAD